jgi:hypothetical protein
MKPLNIDKEQVRMLVLAVGVREAARQMGLKENTVTAWACRYHWLAECKPAALTPLPPSMRPIDVVGVITPSEALENVLKRDADSTKTALSKAARRGAEAIAEMPLEEALEQTQALVGLSKVAEKVHGWGANQGPVGINVLSQINICDCL